MTDTTQVSTELELRLVVTDGPSLPVLATVRYATDDPWAVWMFFQTGDDGEGVEWLFARQLLTDGVTRPAGQGDVRVWPAADRVDRVVHLAMASPSGSALFEIDRTDLIDYLKRTYVVVPSGDEEHVVDLDDELQMLLRDAV